VRIVENHPKTEGAGAQRHRGTDTTETDNAEGLHPAAPDQLALDWSPGRRRALPLPLVIEDHAAAQRQRKRHRVVGDLGRAVVRNVADEDVASGRGRPRDLVVPDTHAHDCAELGKPRDILGCNRIPHDHQPVDLGAVFGVEFGESFDLAPHYADFGPKDPGFETVVRDLPFLGVEHGHCHNETFTG